MLVTDVFDLDVFAVVCFESRTVFQLFARDFVIVVKDFFKIILFCCCCFVFALR